MLESEIMHRSWLAMADAGAKVFRNNCGNGVVGRQKWNHSTATVYSARRIQFGLGVGTSDIVGYLPVTITPDMVGKQVAVFLAAEAKTDTGRATPEQIQFLETVKHDGGIAFIFRSPDEAINSLHV